MLLSRSDVTTARSHAYWLSRRPATLPGVRARRLRELWDVLGREDACRGGLGCFWPSSAHVPTPLNEKSRGSTDRQRFRQSSIISIALGAAAAAAPAPPSPACITFSARWMRSRVAAAYVSTASVVCSCGAGSMVARAGAGAGVPEPEPQLELELELESRNWRPAGGSPD